MVVQGKVQAAQVLPLAQVGGLIFAVDLAALHRLYHGGARGRWKVVAHFVVVLRIGGDLALQVASWVALPGRSPHQAQDGAVADLSCLLRSLDEVALGMVALVWTDLDRTQGGLLRKVG